MTLAEINRMGIEDIDDAMIKLTGKACFPNMTLSARRKRLWSEYYKRAATEAAKQKSTRARDYRPRLVQRRPPYTDALERTLLHAARVGISIEDASTVVEAHLLGDGQFTDDAVQRAMHAFGRLHFHYGWGVRYSEDGIVEVYA